jgi:Glycosyl transferase family 2
MRDRSLSLVVIIPAFNEAETIGPTLLALKKQEAPLAAMGIGLKIYVIDDGSRDFSGKIAEEGGADRVLRHRSNQGLGAAVRTGLIAARDDGADIVVKLDADLQHDPQDVVKIVEPILNDEADIVFGNRFGKISYRMPFIRRVGNAVFTCLMRWMTKWPLKDSQPGIFAAAHCYLSVFSLGGDYNYTQQILLDAHLKGMRFAHVPVAFGQRAAGTSFVSWKYPVKVLPQILMVLVSIKPSKVFGLLGALTMGAAGAIAGIQIAEWAFGAASKPVINVNLVLGLGLFGLQTLYFGLLAELLIRTRK